MSRHNGAARLGVASAHYEEPLAAHQLRMLAEQMPAIVWTIDRDDFFTSVAGAGLEVLGGEPGPVAASMRETLAGTTALPVTIAAHSRALRGRRTDYTACWAERVFECRVEPLRAEGLIVGSIGVAVDVTEKRRALSRVEVAFEEAVDCLVRAIESRDIATGEHLERMSAYCSLIAEAVGLDREQCQAIAVAARLHDIGKIGIPDKLLLKKRKLTDEEMAIIQHHCVAGRDILIGAKSEILQLGAVIAHTHHEWYDGTGYPRGLAGEQIPLAGRIAAIADVFDAMTSNRPYRRALSLETARAEMLAERGTHFDPKLLDLFLTAIGENGCTKKIR